MPSSLEALFIKARRERSKWDDQTLVGRIAVHEIDPLPGNLDAVIAPHQAMKAGTAEQSLRLSPVFQQLQF
jgi:hypothetical protein